MYLRTLGGLKPLEFQRPKPLLLLSYLAVEGPKDRRFLAELFWPGAANRMNSLAKALSQLRQAVPEVALADETTAWTTVKSDVAELLDALDKGELKRAVELYRGPFLESFYLKGWGVELEEWVYATRERFAGHAREALLALGEQAAACGDFDRTRKHAEAAYRLQGGDLLEPAGLSRLHRLLVAGGSVYATEIAWEAESFDIAVATSVADAQAQVLDLQPTRPVKSNLPTPTTPFVGRKTELADLTRLLLDEPDCRLLTLSGPGGIGKTRLALEAAAAVGVFSHGVFFVPLAATASASGIPAAVAEALGFRFYSEAPPRQQLLDYLREKHLLLVLDNFEHLLEGVDLLSDILATASGIKLLVTSRESLHLHEAWRYPVEGLSFPEDAHEEALGDYDALQLFESCARRVRVCFPHEAKRAQVKHICQLVEGTPLALELAASWLHVLPIEGIVRELERGIDILSARHHNVPERHRSMRAVLEQSWQLLRKGEQAVLRRLSVFRGAFSQDAAERVAGASLLTLANLIEKSLLKATEAGRYHLHELLRQFTAERLAEDEGDETATHERHSSYYLEFLKAREDALTSKAQRQALVEIDEDFDNVGAAWKWAVERGDLGAVNNVINSFYRFHAMRSRIQEGYERFAQAANRWQSEAEHQETTVLVGKLIAKQGAFSLFLGRYGEAKEALEASLRFTHDQRDKVFALAMLGRVAHHQGERSASEDHFRSSIALSREVGDLDGLADALVGLSDMRSGFADFEIGKALANECLTISRQLERPDLIAYALGSLAWPTSCLGAYAEAEGYARESLSICQDIGDRYGVALGLSLLGWSAWCIGGSRAPESILYLERALSINREVGHRANLAMWLGDLALIISEQGNHGRAMECALEGLAVARDIYHFDFIPYNLYGLGAAACGLGDFSASRTYLLEAMTISVQWQVPEPATIALFFFAKLLTKESEASETQNSCSLRKRTQAVELLAFILNHPACWQAIKDRAVKLMTELEAALPSGVVAEARTRGRSLSLETVVSEIHVRNGADG